MILLLAKILTTSFMGFAFTLNSSTDPNLKGWDTKSLGFLLNTANCPSSIDLNGIIKDAMKVWNNVATANIEVKLDGTTTSTTFANPPTIFCSTNLAVDAPGADPDAVPGAARVATQGGRIVQALLVLNAQAGAQANIASYNQTILKVVLAHEIGHVLGLGHSEFTPALMYYDASSKAHMTLSQDDIDGITYLYPRNEIGGDGLLGCGHISNNLNGPSQCLFFLVLMAPVILLVNFRRRSYQF